MGRTITETTQSQPAEAPRGVVAKVRAVASQAARGLMDRVGPRPSYGEMGGSGFVWGGLGDKKRSSPPVYNPKIVSQAQWAREKEDILLDPKVRAGVNLKVGRQLSATFRARAADESDFAGEVSDAVNEAFGWEGYTGHLDVPWEVLAAEQFQAYLAGVNISEVIPKVRGGENWIGDLAPRHHGCILGWDADKRTGRVAGVTLRRAAGGGEYTLPIRDPRGGAFHLPFSWSRDPEGRDRAILRPLSYWVALKRHAAESMWTGFSKWANPTVMSVVNFLLARENMTGEGLRKTAVEAARASAQGWTGPPPDKSGTVAMPFCEPRSWCPLLSS